MLIHIGEKHISDLNRMSIKNRFTAKARRPTLSFKVWSVFIIKGIIILNNSGNVGIRRRASGRRPGFGPSRECTFRPKAAPGFSEASKTSRVSKVTGKETVW